MTEANKTTGSPAIPRHVVVAASAWVSRIVTALAQLASVRILMDSLGLENYAVFALLMGLTGWFMLADIGIGASLQNYISEARANHENYDQLIGVSSILALFLLVITVSALHFVSPWIAPQFLKSFPSLTDAQKTNLFFGAGSISITFGTAGVVYKIWYAEQRGYLSNIVPASATLIGLVALLLVKQAPAEDRLLLSLIALMAPTAICPLLALLIRQVKNGLNFSRDDAGHMAKMILKRGVQFWLFAVMAAGVLQIDYIVMSQFLSSRDIATYNIATKVFGLAFFIYNALLLALWPVFSELISKSRWDAVMSYLRKYIAYGLTLMLICTTTFIWLMPYAVRILAPNATIKVSLSLILALGVYQMIRVWTDTFSMLLQSMNVLRPFWVFVPMQAILGGALQWYFAPRLGIDGIVLGLIGSFIFTVAWGLPLSARKRYLLSKEAHHGH